MLAVFPVQCLGIAENRGRFLEEDIVFGEVADGFPRVPREHISVYTLMRGEVSNAILGGAQNPR